MRKFLTLALAFAFLFPFSSCAKKQDGLTYSLPELGGDESAILQDGEHSALIDCGNEVSFVRISQELDRKRIKRLDYLFLTHAHTDHCGGAEQAIKHYKPKNVVLPESESLPQLFKAVLETAKTQNCNIIFATAGDSFTLGNTEIKVLAPYRVIYRAENNYSLVLKIKHGERSILHAADAEKLSENEMLSAFDLRADVLKVAHHGSATSTSPAFCDAVNPDFALINVNTKTNPDAPSEETLRTLNECGATVYRTDTNGTITVTTDGKHLAVKTKK